MDMALSYATSLAQNLLLKHLLRNTGRPLNRWVYTSQQFCQFLYNTQIRIHLCFTRETEAVVIVTAFYQQHHLSGGSVEDFCWSSLEKQSSKHACTQYDFTSRKNRIFIRQSFIVGWLIDRFLTLALLSACREWHWNVFRHGKTTWRKTKIRLWANQLGRILRASHSNRIW